MNPVIWLDTDAYYRVLAHDGTDATKALRTKLVRIGEIGKWSPVSVTIIAVADNGMNVYREVK